MAGGSSAGALRFLPIALVLAATFAVFQPALQNGFVNWDDDHWVYANETLKGPLGWEQIAQILGRRELLGGYAPLTLLTYALEKKLFDLNLSDATNVKAARVLHTTNLLLHLVSVLLAYRILVMLGLPILPAAFAALLFGIHPMRVESVVWITERKDMLLGATYLGALAAYLKFLQAPRYNAAFYAVALLLGLLALLAKVQAASLPLSMLLLDWYFRRPFTGRVLVEKAPFFLLSALFGLWALYVGERSGMLKDVPSYGLVERLAIPAYIYCVYLVKLIFPYEMSPLYLFPRTVRWYHYAAIPAVLGILAAVAWRWKRGDRAFVFAAAFFTFNVVFMLQLKPSGMTFLSDRYTYLPYLGCFFLLGVGLDRIASRRPEHRYLLWASAGAYCLLLAVTSVRQIPIWRNGETLWSHAAEHNPKSPVPLLGRALYYRNFTGDHAKAFADLDRAAALDPRRQETFNQRADLLFELQRIDEAIAQYTKAIELGPRVPGPYASRAAAFASRGQMDLALRDLDRTLELDPHHLHGLMYRALALQQSGAHERALKDYDTYLQLHPGEGNMWYERGLCRRALGREHEAVSDFTEAIRLDPAGQFTPLYYLERARSRSVLGEHDAARGDARQAAQRGATLPPELAELAR